MGHEPLDQPATVVAILDPQQQVRARVRRGPGLQDPALDVVELEGDGHRLGRLRRIGIGFGEVRERLRPRAARAVDTVADRGTVAPGDQQREDPVHDVVVEGPAAAGAVLFPIARRQLDLQERALLDVRLAEVEHQVVGQHQFGQGMRALLVQRPVDLAVEPVPERQVRVQPRPVGALVDVRRVEGVVHVVEVADLQVAVDPVELHGPEHHVRNLGASGALEPDVELAAGQRLRGDADELHVPEHGRAVDLDDEPEDVLPVEIDGAGVGERQLAGGDGLQHRRRVEDERIPARAREDPGAVARVARLAIDRRGHDVAVRQRARALLLAAVLRGGEDTVDDEIVVIDRAERGRGPRGVAPSSRRRKR